MATSKKQTSTKKETAVFRDLRQGTAKKREAAAKQLAKTDAAAAREILLSVLETTKKAQSRAVIVRCLHWVADEEAARMIARSPEYELFVDRLRPRVVATLYRDLEAELGGLSAAEVRERGVRLGLFLGDSQDASDGEDARGDVITRPYALESSGKDEDEWRNALVDLMLRVVDDRRLTELHADASRAILQADLRRGNEALLERWEAEPITTSAFDAYAAWVRLGCPVNATNRANRMQKLYETLIEELLRKASAKEAPPKNIADLDALFATSANAAPEISVRDLVVALARYRRLPKMLAALAKRLVDLTRSTQSLIALVEDGRFEACHALAAKALVDGGPVGARAVLARSDRMPRAILASALAKLEPSEAYDFIAPRIADPGWYAILLDTPSALRDPRFVDLIQQTGALSDRGRDLSLAIARDPRNESRARAVRALAAAARAATDRIERRYALYALGQTGHPDATPALVEALDDPEIGDAVPLVCTALGECGDTRAIKILEQRLQGPHKAFVQSALDFIRGRMTQIHKDVLLAACQDDDPVIADLARRARDGEDDAAIVLEDALRDRGRL